MTSAQLRLMSLFLSICRPHFPKATIDDAHPVPLSYPPRVVRARWRQRSMKTHAGAVGVVGQPVAHDDTGEPTTRAAIITTTDVLMPLAHRRQPSWPLLYWRSRRPGRAPGTRHRGCAAGAAGCADKARPTRTAA